MIDTKALREKILDLAMRGKLVPQDPNDEPASELLKRIKAEKEELIKQKKIKRDKNETEIFRGDDGLHYEKFADGTTEKIAIPFQIPENWAWTNLGTIFQLKAGKFIKASDIHTLNNGLLFPVFGGNGLRGYAEDYNHDGNFPIIGQQGALAGNINFATGKFYAPEHAVVVTCYSEINVKWAFEILLALKLEQYQTGTAQPGLSVTNLNRVLIPLPTPSEQKRIVNELISGNDLINKIEDEQQSLQKLATQLKQKVLDIAMQGKLVPQDPNDEPASGLIEKIRAEKQRLFEEGRIKKKDLVETEIVKGDDNAYYEKLPVGWVKTSLGNIVYLLSGRDLATADYSDSLTTGIPYITGASNFNNGIIQTSRFTEVPQVISEKDDLLITVKGTVGELAFNPFNEAHIARQIMAARPYQLDKEFLMVYLESRIDNMKSQAQSMIPGISRDVLLKMPVDLPPKNEQHRITSQIRKTLQEFDTIC
ncbi:restriction endonuclease subunit S [Enterococcus faecalis]|uniref:restriction endonuclease subunit S n=1 Tax=Enterococcus faecalis TaxID=1351 RepID=UPI001D18FF2F|nr:restriction endonuclease subunit S [Enterococcus faecalis]MCC4085612.1 restriction endonuclease subunit S [Enterococcus faecalis]